MPDTESVSFGQWTIRCCEQHDVLRRWRALATSPRGDYRFAFGLDKEQAIENVKAMIERPSRD